MCRATPTSRRRCPTPSPSVTRASDRRWLETLRSFEPHECEPPPLMWLSSEHRARQPRARQTDLPRCAIPPSEQVALERRDDVSNERLFRCFDATAVWTGRVRSNHDQRCVRPASRHGLPHACQLALIPIRDHTAVDLVPEEDPLIPLSIPEVTAIDRDETSWSHLDPHRFRVLVEPSRSVVHHFFSLPLRSQIRYVQLDRAALVIPVRP